MKKFFYRLHSWVKEVEPWGILIAAAAFVFSVMQYGLELQVRNEQRNLSAWQIVTTSTPDNRTRIDALEYLNSEVGRFCSDWIKITMEWMFDGIYSECLYVQKNREPLIGINLSAVTDCNSAIPSPHERVLLEGINLRFADLRDANLNGAHLSGAILAYARLSRSSLCYADLSGADLTYTSLSGANLSNANLVYTYMSGANLSGADLSNADLTYTNLINANLSGANLSGANLSNADLSGALFLNQDQLDLACGNDFTILPKDIMNIKLCIEHTESFTN